MTTIKTFVFKFANDWSMNLASMIAYNLITTIFPILLAILSIVGFALQLTAATHLQDVAAALDHAFPNALQQNGIAIAPLLHNLVTLSGPFAVAGFIALLWLGSNLFSNIENAFSIIFRIRGRDLVQQRLMAIGMVLILAVLLPLSLGAASLVTTGTTLFTHILPRSFGAVLAVVGPAASLGVLMVLFFVIYVVVPNFEVRIRQAWPGALVATLLFGLLQLLFPLYVQIFLTGNNRYGAVPALILLVIIWLWFFALITVIGAQINAVAMGLRATTYDLARTFELAYGTEDVDVAGKRKTTPTQLTRWRRTLIRRSLRRGPDPKTHG